MTLPSGLISATSMDHSLLEKWTSSLPDSRASHIQSQDTDRESPMSAIFGLKRGELLMRYDRQCLCWRTYQASMFDLTMDGQHMGALYSESFPNSGMIVSGQLYQLPTQAHPISANDGGLWPTPVADGDRTTDYKQGGRSLGAEVRRSETLWPTPTATERSGINPNTGNGAGLSKVIKLWPTPTARDHKDGTAESCSNVPENGLLGRTIHEGQNQPNAALSPDWVEWLMGVPIGWSSPDPLPEGAWEEWITDITSGTWWDTERDIPRVTTERTNRNKRLKALGNGIVPRCIPVFLGVVPCIVQETD